MVQVVHPVHLDRNACSMSEVAQEAQMLEAHEVVSREAWIEARKQLLTKEKEFSRLRDELSRRQGALPWGGVEKDYVFEGAVGQRTLADLFGPCSQLIVYHFMFDPEWDEGCLHCSFWADNFNPNVVHLKARDVTLVAISRAPYAELVAYKQRMGWSFEWFSSFGTDFNFDYGASFTLEDQASEGFYNYTMTPSPDSEVVGVSVFYR